MITFSKLKESVIENGSRILKVFQFGAKTADEVAPFGDDSSALENMTAIFAETSNIGESVVIGYINTNQIAQIGEKRIYSLSENGDLSFSIHLKNDGTCEIGGDNDNAVRYMPLNTAIGGLDTSINAELLKISAAIAGLGGSYVVSTITTDISGSKIDEVKVL